MLQEIEDIIDGDALLFNKKSTKTPARIQVGRSGLRPKTSTILKFRYDHALAVDAVYGTVSDAFLDELSLFSVNTLATTSETFIRRPDLGRRFNDETKKILLEKCIRNPQVQIILSNGLSASAIEANAMDTYLSLVQSLENEGLQLGTSFYIRNGRVGAMDDVGELLNPEVVVYLIGERPGLATAESMSVYMAYKPHIGTIESERIVISNIHDAGMPPVEAGAYVATVVQKMLHYKASGIELSKKENSTIL